MNKSSKVTLTVVAAVTLAHAQAPGDPCQASVFNERACQEAVRQNGYCWNGKWTRLRYSYPYPYYYDRYQLYTMVVGPLQAIAPGACGMPPGGHAAHVHAFPRAGFGAIGVGHVGG